MRLTEEEYARLKARNPDVHVYETVRMVHKPASLRYVPTEHDEQRALFQWRDAMAAQVPALRTMYAIPNGGARDAVTGAMLRAEGVLAGIPDICLPVPRRMEDGALYGALYIEMKRADRSNGPTPSQETVIALLRENGNMAVVCYGCAEAISVIGAYLGLNATSAGVNTCHDSAAC